MSENLRLDLREYVLDGRSDAELTLFATSLKIDVGPSASLNNLMRMPSSPHPDNSNLPGLLAVGSATHFDEMRLHVCLDTPYKLESLASDGKALTNYRQSTQVFKIACELLSLRPTVSATVNVKDLTTLLRERFDVLEFKNLFDSGEGQSKRPRHIKPAADAMVALADFDVYAVMSSNNYPNLTAEGWARCLSEKFKGTQRTPSIDENEWGYIRAGQKKPNTNLYFDEQDAFELIFCYLRFTELTSDEWLQVCGVCVELGKTGWMKDVIVLFFIGVSSLVD